VHSQIDIHSHYGGVVPEVAARSHLEMINPVINQALTEAQLSWDNIDAVAVTYAPGLVGGLLIGTLAARTLALLKNKPLYPIHHVEAHVYANFLNDETPQFPMLALIVSGGHSQLVLFKDHGDYTLLGQTKDDAVGEAFDKVAKILGLSYPGGPSIAKAALQGDPRRYPLPKAKLSGPYDFSFSGLKTAVLRAVQRAVSVDFTFPSAALPERLSDVQRVDFAASFQRIAVETLVDKAERAFRDYSPTSVVIAGGVASNQELRRQLSERLPLHIDYAPISLCTDNAAMIATLGYYYAQRHAPCDPYELEVVPSLSMTKTAWRGEALPLTQQVSVYQ
jgi:N6-L-threonylcarbamoyladenine synthase